MEESTETVQGFFHIYIKSIYFRAHTLFYRFTRLIISNRKYFISARIMVPNGVTLKTTLDMAIALARTNVDL